MIFLFNNTGGYNKVELTNMTGGLFFNLVFIMCQNYFGTILTFQLERAVFVREQANKLYGVLPYFFAKNMMD